MKQLLSILITFALCTASYAQSYKMVDTSMSTKEEETTEINKSITPRSQYDSLSNIRPYDNQDYYKQFIGQTITFYQRNPHSKSLPEYFANFETSQSKVVHIDTIWLKKRVNPKPKDYKLKEVLSNKYKPQYTNYQEITLCGASRPLKSILPFHYYSDKSKKREKYYGYYTPYNAIEGKSFTVINIQHSSDYQEPSIFTLTDENNDTVYWKTHAGNFAYESFSISQNNQFYPIIITGFLRKMEQLYLNKEFYIKNIQPIMKYKCIDIVYSGRIDEYMVPSFVLKSDSTELIMPLTKAPEIFSYKIGPNNPSIHTHDFSSLELLDTKSYTNLIEKERIAKVEKLEKERIAKANADKEQALATQKRVAYLNKKYGARIGKMILNGEVQIGMTREMCEEAWGSPQKINTTITTQTVSEQWVYGGHSYLYFTNGRLTAIQN